MRCRPPRIHHHLFHSTVLWIGVYDTFQFAGNVNAKAHSKQSTLICVCAPLSFKYLSFAKVSSDTLYQVHALLCCVCVYSLWNWIEWITNPIPPSFSVRTLKHISLFGAGWWSQSSKARLKRTVSPKDTGKTKATNILYNFVILLTNFLFIQWTLGLSLSLLIHCRSHTVLAPCSSLRYTEGRHSLVRFYSALCRNKFIFLMASRRPSVTVTFGSCARVVFANERTKERKMRIHNPIKCRNSARIYFAVDKERREWTTFLCRNSELKTVAHVCTAISLESDAKRQAAVVTQHEHLPPFSSRFNSVPSHFLIPLDMLFDKRRREMLEVARMAMKQHITTQFRSQDIRCYVRTGTPTYEANCVKFPLVRREYIYSNAECGAELAKKMSFLAINICRREYNLWVDFNDVHSSTDDRRQTTWRAGISSSNSSRGTTDNSVCVWWWVVFNTV